LLNDSIAPDDLKAASELVRKFADALDSCLGIDVLHECLRKSDVTVAELEQYQRFTDYDYLSYNE